MSATSWLRKPNEESPSAICPFTCTSKITAVGESTSTQGYTSFVVLHYRTYQKIYRSQKTMFQSLEEAFFDHHDSLGSPCTLSSLVRCVGMFICMVTLQNWSSNRCGWKKKKEKKTNPQTFFFSCLHSVTFSARSVLLLKPRHSSYNDTAEMSGQSDGCLSITTVYV